MLTRLITYMIVTAALLNTEIGVSQVHGRRHGATDKDRNVFATNEYWAKGGLGIINENLYIILKSDKNQLLIAGKEWTGLGASTPEVVFYVDGRVLAVQSLPNGFDLSNSIVLSFEDDKVRFFDFAKMSGGYYRRQRQQ